MEIDTSTPQGRIANAQTAAEKAEREAAERTNVARKRVREADAEAEKELGRIQDTFEKRATAERLQGDHYVEAVKNRTYENLAETRRRSEAEEARLLRQNRDHLHKEEKEYQRQAIDLRHHGDQKTQELTKENHSMEERLRHQGENARQELTATADAELASLHATQVARTDEARKTSEAAISAAHDRTRDAIDRAHDHYEAAYEGAVKQSKDAIDDVNWRAIHGIENLRRDTQAKLDAYASQKKDPFYQMVSLDARISEDDDRFTITARIPAHERDGVSVNVQGDQVVVSGKRRSEDKLEIEPGRTQRTSAYQTYSETFPLTWPVNSKYMTREWDGDTLVVRIPKRLTYAPPAPKRQVEPAVAERPRFPKSVPTEAQLARAESQPEDDSTPPSKRKKAGSVLG